MARNPTLTRKWVQQCRARHRSLCNNRCRPLYGEQSHLDTEMSAAVQGPSSVPVHQLMSSALRRNPTLTRNWVQLWRVRRRSLCSNWCCPLYGAQSHLDTELSAAVKGPSSVAMQQCSYECGCRFCQRVPCSAVHSVARIEISEVTVSVAWWPKFKVTTHITEIRTLMPFFFWHLTDQMQIRCPVGIDVT